ncbi:hypothetical protein [Candidatus Rhabdochlamydia oedothoracis]|uniref:hypothetical protein n=1 Tax=Candidatus Rhabdochlamydia oedothoracis TaxID=2720720 RepID=UPI001C64D1C3|nr:hypothetical protein [Candidatus Rhabdochlamydia oedothoracis]
MASKAIIQSAITSSVSKKLTAGQKKQNTASSLVNADLLQRMEIDDALSMLLRYSNLDAKNSKKYSSANSNG